MKRMAFSLALALTLAGLARAEGTLKKITGETVKGEVTAMSTTEVTMTKTGGVEEKISVVEIDSIRYDKEPAQLQSIRNQIANGGYENGLKALDKIDPATVEDPFVKADLEYLRAYCNARLALGGSFDVAKAGKGMLDFVNNNKENYHVLVANGLIGDLLVSNQKYADATKYYTAMGAAPIPEFKMRAGVSTGRALMAQAKFPEALKQFEDVLALAQTATGAVADSQRMAATLGKAACLAETGNPDEGIKMVDEVIAKLAPEDAELHAQAYVTLGNCYAKKPESSKPALLAFLHVDVLYFSNPQAHAEALFNLAKLWNDIGKPERAIQASQLLKERYPNSQWAKR